MSKVEISYDDSMQGNYLMASVTGDDIDSIAVNVIQQDRPDFLLPLSLKSRDDETMVRYELPTVGSTALAYTNLGMNKKEFIRLFVRLIMPLIDCDDWFLSAHNFLMEPDNIFVEQKTGKVSFVYIPTVDHLNTDQEIIDFYKSLFKKANVKDDPGLLLEIYRYLDDAGNTSLKGLYQIIKEKDDSVKEDPPITQQVARPVPTPALRQVMDPHPAQQPTQGQRQMTPGGQRTPAAMQPPIVQKQPMSAKPTAPTASVAPQNTPVHTPAPMAESNSNRIGSGGDSFEALFGSPAKPEKKKKKEKPPKVPKEKAEKKPREKFSFFGKKTQKDEKLQTGTTAMQPKPNNNPIPVPQQIHTAPVVPQQQVYNQTSTMPEPVAPMQRMTLDTSVTLRLDDDMDIMQGDGYMQLLSSAVNGAPEVIPLDGGKDVLSIGRISGSEVKPDISFPADFRTIGRRHAQLIKENGEYYIVDLGSQNHTTLNGEVMAANRKYKVENGAVIGFTVSKPVKYRVILN